MVRVSKVELKPKKKNCVREDRIRQWVRILELVSTDIDAFPILHVCSPSKLPFFLHSRFSLWLPWDALISQEFKPQP